LASEMPVALTRSVSICSPCFFKCWRISFIDAIIIAKMDMRIVTIFFSFLLCSASQAAELPDVSQPPDSIGIGRDLLQAVPDAINNLLQYAVSHEGVAYRRGGNSPESGFDCSGFVSYVFDHVEGVTLPHSAQAISRIGTRIKMTELLPGDLVFFRLMRNTISHVGIYLGNNQFIHASSTNTGSVMVSSLSDNYWAKHFTLARRLDVPADE